MTYDEVMAILEDGDGSDWSYDDAHGVFAYKKDLHLRIVRRQDGEDDTFEGEAWATNHPDPTAYRVMYDVLYGATFVAERLLVAVDGYRAILPLPEANSNRIQRSKYQFARIIDVTDSLDEYINRSGLTVS